MGDATVVIFNLISNIDTIKGGTLDAGVTLDVTKLFVLSYISCNLKNNLVVNREVRGYLQSIIYFKRCFVQLDPITFNWTQ